MTKQVAGAVDQRRVRGGGDGSKAATVAPINPLMPCERCGRLYLQKRLELVADSAVAAKVAARRAGRGKRRMLLGRQFWPLCGWLEGLTRT
jgi:hypothetical protein